MNEEKFTVDVLPTQDGFDVCVMDEAGEVLEVEPFADRELAHNFAWSKAVQYGCIYREATPPEGSDHS